MKGITFTCDGGGTPCANHELRVENHGSVLNIRAERTSSSDSIPVLLNALQVQKLRAKLDEWLRAHNVSELQAGWREDA